MFFIELKDIFLHLADFLKSYTTAWISNEIWESTVIFLMEKDAKVGTRDFPGYHSLSCDIGGGPASAPPPPPTRWLSQNDIKGKRSNTQDQDPAFP